MLILYIINVILTSSMETEILCIKFFFVELLLTVDRLGLDSFKRHDSDSNQDVKICHFYGNIIDGCTPKLSITIRYLI